MNLIPFTTLETNRHLCTFSVPVPVLMRCINLLRTYFRQGMLVNFVMGLGKGTSTKLSRMCTATPQKYKYRYIREQLINDTLLVLKYGTGTSLMQ
jgi:hypothetical protein